MLGHREPTMEDYVAILQRRKWVIIIPLLLGPLVALGVSFLLPEVYTSETLVLVEQQKVPEAFVRSVVTDELNTRLGSMREQILSRTRLQPIIERFGLFKKDMGDKPMEELVDRLREDITVTTIRPMVMTRGNELPGFTISVSLDDARTAQQVCSEITSMFLEENLRAREQRAEGTTQFLAKQLEEAKQRLDEQDKQLAAFKQKYIGQLPEQEQRNMNLLASQNTQLDAVNQALVRLQQDKIYTESVLAQQVAAWKEGQGGTNPETLERQLERLESELVGLEARYTADHPDVVKTKANISQLKKKIEDSGKPSTAAQANASETVALNEPKEIRQLRDQLHVIARTIAEKTKEQEQLQAQIKISQARVQMSPVVEQQYKELTRGYETAFSFYNDMLTKRTQSEMATDLERRQQGEQFRIMDPANLPEKPTFPNRPLFAGFGAAGGFGIGLGLALILELRDKAIRSERDVEYFLKLPTLALLPSVAESSPRLGFLRRRQEARAPRG